MTQKEWVAKWSFFRCVATLWRERQLGETEICPDLAKKAVLYLVFV